MKQQLIFTNHVAEAIDNIAAASEPSGLFVLVDTNTAHFVLPRLQAESTAIAKAQVITVAAGEAHKNIDTLTTIWDSLSHLGCRRDSLLINVGGGVITDMGSFAASTFKRGIRFINMPTTLLGAVDASVGGKTGINLNGLKNEVGLFNDAELVLLSTTFFNTLPATEMRSGYAEMIKHALLDSPDTYHRLLGLRADELSPDTLLELLRDNVTVKTRIVGQDHTEQGMRRALNLGHTFAHAFESLAMEHHNPIPHGYAVAHGLVCSMIMSHMLLGFSSDETTRLAGYVHSVYGIMPYDCDDYGRLLELMSHDKKNSGTAPYNFTLLRAVGEPVIDCHPTDGDITATLDIYRDKMTHISASTD